MYVRLEWCDLAMLTTSSGLSLLSNLAYRLSLDSSTPVDGKDHKGDAGEISHSDQGNSGSGREPRVVDEA